MHTRTVTHETTVEGIKGSTIEMTLSVEITLEQACGRDGNFINELELCEMSFNIESATVYSDLLEDLGEDYQPKKIEDKGSLIYLRDEYKRQIEAAFDPELPDLINEVEGILLEDQIADI